LSSKESNVESNRRASFYEEASSGFPSFENQLKGSYEEDLLGTASWEVNGPNRRNSFEDKQGTPIKVRKSPNSRKPAPTKPQSLRRHKGRSSAEKLAPPRLIKTPFEQVREEASASTYQEQFRPASVLAARGKLRARPKIQSIQEVESSKPKLSLQSVTPATTATTRLDIDDKRRPAVWDSQYEQVFPSPTFRPRVASTRGTSRARSSPRGKSRHSSRERSSKEVSSKETQTRSSLINKLKSLMHVPKAHPVSISDELSGGSRYFGAASIFGAASESQESTGLF
jgi:hypothetical protein